MICPACGGVFCPVESSGGPPQLYCDGGCRKRAEQSRRRRRRKLEELELQARRARACEVKVKHATPETAFRAWRAVSSRKSTNIGGIYECSVCGWWHVTRDGGPNVIKDPRMVSEHPRDTVLVDVP